MITIVHCGVLFTPFERLKNVDVVIDQGKIKDIHPPVPTDDEVFEADYVIPGLIDPHTHIGIYRGVLVALMTGHPVIPQKHLRLLASVVVRNGASYDQALKMISVNPAIILKLNDHLGTIEPGKDADLVVWSDYPLKAGSSVEYVIIDGEIVLKNP